MNLPHSFNICPCSIYPTAKTTRVIKCYNRKLQATQKKDFSANNFAKLQFLFQNLCIYDNWHYESQIHDSKRNLQTFF